MYKRQLLSCALPQIAGNLAFAIVVLSGYIKGLPVELEEAAYMEGCNAYQIFFKVIMPLTKPSFATVGIFSFLWSYNDLFTQTFFLRFPAHWAITRLLNEISGRQGTDVYKRQAYARSTNPSVSSAGSVSIIVLSERLLPRPVS